MHFGTYSHFLILDTLLFTSSSSFISGSDNQLFIWNVETSDALIDIDCLPDIPLSLSWNFDGSKFVVSCKDKKVRIIDPRTGDILKV